MTSQRFSANLLKATTIATIATTLFRCYSLVLGLHWSLSVAVVIISTSQSHYQCQWNPVCCKFCINSYCNVVMFVYSEFIQWQLA